MPIQEVGTHDTSQLKLIANALVSSRKIIVVTGAGISTNCGIPDFRSENGLYSLIESQPVQEASIASPHSLSPTAPAIVQPSLRLKGLKGKDLFSSAVWNDAISTSTFNTFIASLRRKIYREVQKPSRTHGFIRALRDSNRLIRCYTQNIDGLETREGLCTDLDRGSGCRTRFSRNSTRLLRTPAHELPGGALDGGCEVVQLHGNLEVLKCTICRETCTWEEQSREAHFFRGETPPCPACEGSAQDRQDRGKRVTKIGVLRPNIVLYGEEHPSAELIGKLSVHDLGMAPDLLLILGTSLQVHGLKILVKEFAKSVHARAQGKGKVIFVNLSKPSESMWKNVIDFWVSMDCDEWVDSVRAHRPDLWQLQTQLDVQTTKPRSDLSKSTKRKKQEVDARCRAKIRRPLQEIPNESQRSSSSKDPLAANTDPLAKDARIQMRKNSPYFPTNLDSRAPKDDNECQPQDSPTKESNRNPQLMTPPPSGHRHRLQPLSHEKKRHRPIVLFEEEEEEEEEQTNFPQILQVKRFKPDVQIWQDEDIIPLLVPAECGREKYDASAKDFQDDVLSSG